ncbi:hypothetical protein CWB99_01450 [Pseudoalteromonas rubra]|uniref:Molecular chaperone n=1 Tax=Pseudoalteromonas rubra TaxID=43658 RepID=A0A5S3WV14_9GAMM|nr:hypothetical protein [Pseudoalteromonas rubra]TMP28125.1 hypothetical protein CWC00_22175 [Pseudoalteromonas rubra]TMP32789.1 hypothetical protein CWB99_01450 [Pseudoalteromonas rubra]
MNKAFFTLVLLLSALTSQAWASTFKLDRHRVVLDQETRRGELRIYNTSDSLQSYRVSLIDMEMDATGSLKIADQYQFSAKPYLRVGPRVAKDVLPKQFQKIRLMKKGKIPDGEFRAHLMVEALSASSSQPQSGAVTVRANYKVIIPVFIKNTSSSTELTFGAVAFSKDTKNMLVSLHKQGPGHTSANLVVMEGEEELFRINQFSLYPELSQRDMSLPLEYQSLIDKKLTLRLEDVESKELLKEQTVTISEQMLK